MPIPLSNNAASRPYVKLPQPGIGAEVCLIGQRVTPKMKQGTQQQDVTRDGKPRNQLVLTGILVGHNGALTGPQGAERALTIGEVVDVFLDGPNWHNYIQAEKALQQAGLTPQVGDVLTVVFTHTEPSQMPGGNPRKVRQSTLRRARPDEQHYVAQAESLYYSLGFDRPADAPAPISLQSQPGPFDGPAQPQYGQQPQPQFGQQPAPQFGQQPQPQYAPQPAAPAPVSPYGAAPAPAAPPQQQPQYAPQAPAQAPQTGYQPGPGF